MLLRIGTGVPWQGSRVSPPDPSLDFEIHTPVQLRSELAICAAWLQAQAKVECGGCGRPSIRRIAVMQFVVSVSRSVGGTSIVIV